MINLEGSPNSYIVAAYHEHISIKIRCCVEIGGFYYVVDAKGHINDINGMNAQYVVQDVKILLDPVSKDNNRASFSFILKNIQNRDKLINANIIGEAFINKTTHDAAGNLRSLLLQFPRKYTVRPIRSSKRYVLKENINHFFKVVLPAEIPKTRTGLVNLLREPSEYITDNARIVNLSRGGACICLPEELARPLLSSGTMYVVFFAPANVGTQDNTYLWPSTLAWAAQTALPGCPCAWNSRRNWTQQNLLGVIFMKRVLSACRHIWSSTRAKYRLIPSGMRGKTSC